MKVEDFGQDIIDIISKTLAVKSDELKEIKPLKKGMTNHSFLITCKNGKYILRIPGEGTELLINRCGEAEVYRIIAEKGISEDVLYIDSKKGFKISRFFENARCCDAQDYDDIIRCMDKLRMMHEMKLTVDHEFDIFERIDFYESLRNGAGSVYDDYAETKEKILSLKPYIEAHIGNKVLTHIDAVPDNFLFVTDRQGNEEVRLIDWEYAGMQDPHVDIAMFCIYALYDRQYIDRLIQAYFKEGCSKEIQIKIYGYIASCGLLWSNWCEYKQSLGVNFGVYASRQYQYAKDYYQILQNELRSL